MNFLEGTLSSDGGAVRFASPDVTLKLAPSAAEVVQGKIGQSVFLGIRPEDIHDSVFLPDADPENVKALHTEVVEPLGAETLVYLRGEESQQDIVAKFDSRSNPRVNEEARVAFDVTKVHVFDGETEDSLTYSAEHADRAAG